MYKKNIIFIAGLILSVNAWGEDTQGPMLARHELFWEFHDVWYSFASWSLTYDQPSSKRAREYIRSKSYQSILDVGCGVCPEYFGFAQDKYQIMYRGIDITPRILNYGKENNIPMVFGHAEKIPADDTSYEIVYARHLLEHMRYYKKVIAEMVRVAQKEVLIVFFIEPGDAPDHVDYRMQDRSALFNNFYNKEKLEAFLRNLPRVQSWDWEVLQKSTPSGNESLLHIYVQP